MTIYNDCASRMHWMFAIPLLFLMFGTGCKRDKNTEINCDEVSLALEGNGAVEYGNSASFRIHAKGPAAASLQLQDSLGNKFPTGDGNSFKMIGVGPYDANYFFLVHETEGCGVLTSERIYIRPYAPVINCNLPAGIKARFSDWNDAVSANFSVTNNHEIYGYFTQAPHNLTFTFVSNCLRPDVFEPASDIGSKPSHKVMIKDSRHVNGNVGRYEVKKAAPKSQWLQVTQENGKFRLKACDLTLFRVSGTGPDSVVLSFDFLTK